MSATNICAYCNAEFSSENLACTNCEKINFPSRSDEFTSFNIFLIKFGYFFTFFLFGTLAGIGLQKINKSGIFIPQDMGFVMLGITLGKYFSDKKERNSFVWVLSGSIICGLFSALIYAYFVEFFYFNIIITVLTAVLFGGVFGLIISRYKKINDFKRTIFIVLASMFVGLIINCTGGVLIDVLIIKEFSFNTIINGLQFGILSGAIFGLVYLLSERVMQKKITFIGIFYNTIGAMVCGGMLGAIVDATNFNPFWSGLFNVQENIFLSIRMGFLRDSIICGFIALGITSINSFSIKTDRSLMMYINTMIGGIIGGVLGIYFILNFPIDLLSFSAIEKTFYELLNGSSLSNNLWLLIGGIFGGAIALGILIGKDIFTKNTFSGFVKILTRSLGGFVGGILAGIICGTFIFYNNQVLVNIKEKAVLIFLISIICSMYGLLIALGISLNRFSFNNK